MNQRIAIIGAGPAGLTAAWQLKARGYNSVKIFEKNKRVGGKCCTPTIDGRNYELGAVIVGPTTYRVVNQLIKEFGLSCTPINKTKLLDSSRGGGINKFKMAIDFFIRYRPALKKFFAANYQIPEFSEAGYLGFDLETFGVTFTDWAKREGLEDLIDIFAPIYTGFGYGYLNQISAPQFFKIYDPGRLQKSFNFKLAREPGMVTIDEGFQGLFERVAAQQNVLLDCRVSKIERGETVKITTGHGTEEFDKLILACPLHRIHPAMDLSSTEKKLFKQIRIIDYQTVTAEIEGLGPKGLMFMVDNMTDDRAGHIVCGYRRYSETDIWAIYAINDGTNTDAQIIEKVSADLKAVGATLKHIHRHDKWDFYPNVSPESFRSGFYPAIESIQGDNNTYIAGEIMGAATVESTSNYSNELVKRFFPKG
ncbi:MAG: NAD(P)-binding protein [Deltaproteobacteria bacterium]|nr:NAD(P)-binding protein [Deltaproteobacteria bacterium]MBT6491563.1 NAD(P)-binding protein [Deltaproteobacteria bacterium]